jgi:FecR protein/Putative zinc-finger
MTQGKGNHPEFDDAINAMKRNEPTGTEVGAAAGRVWQKLQSTDLEDAPEMIRGCEDVSKLLPTYLAGQLSAQRSLLVETHLRDCVACRRKAEGRESANVLKWTRAEAARPVGAFPRFALAAATMVLAVVGFFTYSNYFAIPAGARATLQSVDGTAYRVTPEGDQAIAVGEQLNDGDVLRTASGAHAFVKLSDGSLVEVRERSEFNVKARGKDMTIALDRGAVIVQAAKRDTGHLYVKTPDCRVGVTGTIFSVNSGVKGSRVLVVEGSVEVQHGANDDMLRPGDQVATGDNMTPVSAEEEIAWSRNLSKHLELLASLKKLQKSLEQVSLPAPRYNSTLLGRMPADTLFYASLPNAGQALEEANRILQAQIAQSASLREWFAHGDPDAANKMNETIAKIRSLSDYLGDEVVVVGFGGQKSGMAVIAEVRRTGLADFLRTQFKDAKGKRDLRVIGESDLVSSSDQTGEPVALVRQNEVIFAGDRASLIRVNAQLNAGGAGLESTEFGKRLLDAYSRGAGFLLGADLHAVIADKKSARNSRRHHHGLEQTGFEDMRYLIVEHREVNQVPENRMVLDFAGARRGVPSWLGAPGPMGALEFVSRNAAVAVAVVAKDPQLIFDDILTMEANSARRHSELAETEAKLKLRIREDLAAHFGGDGVIALDGPVLPTPAWKFVVEVHDTVGLQASLASLVQACSEEAIQRGGSGVDLKTEDVGGQRYYTIQSRSSKAKPMYYTFAAGYMIIGPDRATLMNTLRTRLTGDSLARSGEFKALLPKDDNANYSFIAYQNLAPILQPLLSTVDNEQAKVIQELAADSRPSVVAGWGRNDRIEAVTNSRLLGFDWLALGSLFPDSQGTRNRRNP